MVFGRKKGFLGSWGSKPEKESDPEFAAKVQKLAALEKALVQLQDNMRLYLASWHQMCAASVAIADGLAVLAGENSEATGMSPLSNMAQMYHSAQNTIDGFVREPAQRVAEETALSDTGALLSRFPPIHKKIARRRQLLADVESAESRVRAAEAAKDKERDSVAAAAGAEHRRRMASMLSTAATVAQGVTRDVIRDADRLEKERGAMLVPQVSALVGCQAYFMRRSAAVLERLASDLPYSAIALCKLLRPKALDGVPFASMSASTATTRQASSSFSSFNDSSGRYAAAPVPSYSRGGSEPAGADPTRLGSRQAPPTMTTTATEAETAPLPTTSSVAISSNSSPGANLNATRSWRPLPPPPPPQMAAPVPGSVSAASVPVVVPSASGTAVVEEVSGEGIEGVWGVAEDDDGEEIVEEVTW